MILEVDNIELNFGNKKILSAIYIKAEKGKITGILGRNGCGKSCLLEIIFGNLKPKYQNIRINTKKVKPNLYSLKNIAYLPQYSLIPKDLKLATLFKLFEQDWKAFIMVFDSFKVYKKSRLKNLSSGEIRVVETYLILNSKKDIILLDEPFSFIAPIYVEQFKIMLHQIKKEKIILITDHFYNDILELSDTIYFLKNGYSKLITTTEELEKEGYLINDKSAS